MLWVDPPISILTPLNDAAAAATLREDRLREVAPGIMRLSPVTVPGVTRPGLRELALRQAQRSVRRAVARLGVRVHSTIVASLTDMLDVVPAGRRVFFGTDDYVAGAALMGTDPALARADRGAPARQGRRRDRDLAACCSASGARGVPTCTSSPTAAWRSSSRWPTRRRSPPASSCRRRSPASSATCPSASTWRCSSAVAEAGVSLLLVGPRSPTFEIAKLDALLARPNVQWVGPQPFAALPSYLRAIDVGLTPYAQSDFNEASFPLKTLEYLAAGRPGRGQRPAGAPLDRLAARDDRRHARRRSPPRRVDLLERPPAPREAAARRAFGAANSWASRADEVARLIGLDAAPELRRAA